MAPRRTIILYLCLAALCLAAARPVEARLAAMRQTSGLATYSGENARAGAAFVRCLGGLRGILADLIWMRALRMQDSGRYYEIVALLDGLLEMQPHFVSVWLFQAHVLAFDFGSPRVEPDPVEAFRWVERGIGVLERGIERNPTSALLEKRLAELYLYKLSPASPNPEWKLQAGLLNAQLSGREVPAGREPQELVRLMNRRLAELARRDGRPPAEPDNYTALRLARGHFLRAADKAKTPDAAGLKLLCQRFAIRCLERMGDWSTAESSWRSLFESQGRKDPNGFFQEFMRSVVGELLLMGRTAESREAFGRLRGYFPEAEASYREFLAAEIRSDQARRKTERAGQLYRALRAVEPGETRSYEEITGQTPPAEGTGPGPGRGN